MCVTTDVCVSFLILCVSAFLCSARSRGLRSPDSERTEGGEGGTRCFSVLETGRGRGRAPPARYSVQYTVETLAHTRCRGRRSAARPSTSPSERRRVGLAYRASSDCFSMFRLAAGQGSEPAGNIRRRACACGREHHDIPDVGSAYERSTERVGRGRTSTRQRQRAKVAVWAEGDYLWRNGSERARVAHVRQLPSQALVERRGDTDWRGGRATQADQLVRGLGAHVGREQDRRSATHGRRGQSRNQRTGRKCATALKGRTSSRPRKAKALHGRRRERQIFFRRFFSRIGGRSAAH